MLSSNIQYLLGGISTYVPHSSDCLRRDLRVSVLGLDRTELRRSFAAPLKLSGGKGVCLNILRKGDGPGLYQGKGQE